METNVGRRLDLRGGSWKGHLTRQDTCRTSKERRKPLTFTGRSKKRVTKENKENGPGGRRANIACGGEIREISFKIKLRAPRPTTAVTSMHCQSCVSRGAGQDCLQKALLGEGKGRPALSAAS